MSNLAQLLADLEMEKVLPAAQEELDSGTPPQVILNECQEGMVDVGNRFAKGEYYVSDLMMSGVLFKQVAELLEPYLKGSAVETRGRVVLGTVQKDVHDIGKDIVGNMLKASGFDVIDVGVDTPPEKFVNALKESGAKVLGLSCLLASCYDSLLSTVEAVKKEGLRDSVKIIIGGGPVDETVVAYCGADAYGMDAQATVDFCKGVY